MWNLANKLTTSASPLIMASQNGPYDCFGSDDHLSSRITSGLVLQLYEPENFVRLLILDKIARDMCIRLPREVASYLITRKSRNLNDLSRLLEILNKASLELQRRITLPLVKALEKEDKI